MAYLVVSSTNFPLLHMYQSRLHFLGLGLFDLRLRYILENASHRDAANELLFFWSSWLKKYAWLTVVWLSAFITCSDTSSEAEDEESEEEDEVISYKTCGGGECEEECEMTTTFSEDEKVFNEVFPWPFIVHVLDIVPTSPLLSVASE